MCIISCLEGNRVGYINPKGHKHKSDADLQILRFPEHRSKTCSVQIISICHDCVMGSIGWIL